MIGNFDMAIPLLKAGEDYAVVMEGAISISRRAAGGSGIFVFRLAFPFDLVAKLSRDAVIIPSQLPHALFARAADEAEVSFVALKLERLAGHNSATMMCH